MLRPEELDGLTVIPPADFAGEIKLSVTAIAAEATGDVASTKASVALQFAAVADGAGAGSRPDAGLEDRAIPLNLFIAGGDADGSERLVAVTLSGLPRGASIAPGIGIRDGGNGIWTVAPEALGDVRMIPPANAPGSFGLIVTTIMREASNGAEASVSRGVTVTVAASADAPSASAMDATGREDQPIALNLSAALQDTDGSETLSIVIAGLPDGARLSAGINNGDGTWMLTPAQLGGLTLAPPRDWSGSMVLTMTAHAMERSTAGVASTQVPFRVAVAGVADAPLLEAATIGRGVEDQSIAIDIVARLTDTDGSETMTRLVLSGLPEGFSLTAGAARPDGSVALRPAELAGLRLQPPADWNGTVSLTLSATVRDGDNTATTQQPFNVSVAAVNDAPRLQLLASPGAATGQASADIVHDATITDVDSPVMGGATITLTGGAATERLAFAGHPIQQVGGRSMLGSTGIEVSYDADRKVTLSGSASASTYAEVLEGMAVETASSAGLEAGSRSIGVTLRDESGAAAAAQSVTLNIQPSQIAGDGSDQVPNGTTGHDLFIGSAGDEWMRGGAGADVFTIAMGGGHDTVDGGTGAWTDEIRLTSAPATGNLTLVLDEGSQMKESGQAMDFSQPASGHIQFADGGQLEFSQIERIVW